MKTNALIATRLFANPNICTSIEKDGSTILNIEKGNFYSLIGFGSTVWARLSAHPEGVTLEAIADELHADHHDIPRQKLESGLENLLDDLHKKGLVQIGTGGTIRKEERRDRIITAVMFLLRLSTGPLLKRGQNSLAAFLYLAFFQLIGKIGGFRARRIAVRRWPVAPRPVTDPEVLLKLCAAVAQACTWYPKLSKCLQHSTATTCLLRQYGFPAEMVIGVHKMPFSGHSWVEVEGIVVNDHKNVQKYFRVLDRW
jgi:Transglutaminase-like superfamily/Coenzyme PQQ synthesis protein D (PqqD)